MPNDERNLETIPDGMLGLIPLESCKELGVKVDSISMKLTLLSKVTAATPISFPLLFRVSEPVKQKLLLKSL